MTNSLAQLLRLVLVLVLNSALLLFALFFTNTAKAIENEQIQKQTIARELTEKREWLSWTADFILGADVVDFIVTHKDSCDIVIRDNAFNSSLNGYLTNGALIMGLSDKKNIPEQFWTVTYAYDIIINRSGSKKYTVKLLYDGELVGGSVGNAITGIEFTAA